jgi:hypothetical protein
VDAEEVARSINTMTMGTRDGLLAIPSRIAPILAAETDERQVYQTLDEEIRRTLGFAVRESPALSLELKIEK